MDTLSYGFKKPQDGDRGDTLYTALEDNVQLTNDHTHNGVNSPKVSIASLSKFQQAISNAGWVAHGQATYRQLVTMGNGLLFDSSTITFRDDSGLAMFLDYERVATTTFYVYCNDNTKNIVAIYW